MTFMKKEVSTEIYEPLFTELAAILRGKDSKRNAHYTPMQAKSFIECAHTVICVLRTHTNAQSDKVDLQQAETSPISII